MSWGVKPPEADMTNGCVFCQIIARNSPASFVREDALSVAFVDIRQFHQAMFWLCRKHTCRTCGSWTVKPVRL